MKEFAAGDSARNTGDLFEAAAVAPVAITKHRFVVMSTERYEALTRSANRQIALDVADMPEELGKLWDEGVEEHFLGR